MTRWSRPIPEKTRTAQGRANGMAMALAYATDAALERLTADDLVRQHGVPLKEATYGLQMARQRRERPTC